LDRLLHSVHFRNSKRCQSLLKYVVEEAVSGHHDQLKERTIGVQVFGREPAYDTNQDAVVRNAAVEVRKRLAQYYLDPAHENQMRISLPLGAYAPDFSVQTAVPVEAAAEVRPVRPVRRWIFGALAILGIIACGGWALAALQFGPAAELKKFWGPILDAPETVQICVGSAEMQPGGKDLLYVRDGYAMARVAALLQANHKLYHLRNDSTAPFSEVRRSPLILIGAFNNFWTMRLMSELRYSFATEMADGIRYKFILDRQHPNDRRWEMKAGNMSAAPDKDYLIVTRVQDSTTERTVISVAGFADYGTLAAGEFSTDAAYLKKAFRDAPRGWEKKNIQVVLQAKFIEGTPGPPEVLAAYFW